MNADSWLRKHCLLTVALAPLVAQLIGSAFNIWYNLSQVEPLLTDAQHDRLVVAVVAVNLVVYPLAVAAWLWVVFRLRPIVRARQAGTPVDDKALWKARRGAINLPWWMFSLGGAAWLICIPVLIMSLNGSADPIDGRVHVLLSVSIVVSALIAITHGFFAIELASQQFLFPVLFADTQPSDTPGAFPLTFRGRWTAWAISAGVCPIVSLLLLFSTPAPRQDLVFPSAVGLLAIIFGLTTAWMMGRFYSEPVMRLRTAAEAVGQGELNTRVDVLRADDFGPLVAEFNAMVSGLREKERIRRTFGLHVGHEAARQILERDPGLGGVTQQLTILFVDIRDFTASCRTREPQTVVCILNEFLTEMVDVVQTQHRGMVNKFLGDGFMALFGVGDEKDDHDNHAEAAVRAGQMMLARLDELNKRLDAKGIVPLQIGIGIHTGEVLVGSIGSADRLEFTAIGDAVNIASRVESLTKEVGMPLLMTEATRASLKGRWDFVECESQQVKGLEERLKVFGLD